MSPLRCGRFTLSLDRPLIMGIVNMTPDSFSDGGRFLAPDAAIDHARRLIDEGADLLDLGAESSRPGATPLPMTEELARLLPVLEALRDASIPISVDTYKPEVMRAALDHGASMINDIRGLGQPGALEAIAPRDCAVCVMHMQGNPQTMQNQPVYANVTAEVRDYLGDRVATLTRAGIAQNRIVVDPGFGFGKTPEQNFEMLRELASFTTLGVPVLAGLSRKSMLGAVTGKPVGERAGAGIAAALAAVARGATLLRVHDVALTVDALKIWEMVENRT